MEMKLLIDNDEAKNRNSSGAVKINRHNVGHISRRGSKMVEAAFGRGAARQTMAHKAPSNIDGHEGENSPIRGLLTSGCYLVSSSQRLLIFIRNESQNRKR